MAELGSSAFRRRRVRTFGLAMPWIAGVAIAVLTVCAQLPLLDRSVVPIDEGQVASFARRILAGEVLYRDMYTGIAPGIYYTTALLFRVFGADLVVTRWAQLVVNVLTALCLWRVALRVVAGKWAILPPLMYCGLIIWGFPMMTMFAYSSLSMLFALGTLLFLMRYLERGSLFDGMAVGLLVAASVLVKQNYGALALIAVLYRLLDGWMAGRVERPVRALAPIVMAGASAALATLAFFASKIAAADLLRYTVASIFTSQLESFDQPIPPIFAAHPLNDGRFIFLYVPGVLFNYLIRGEALFGYPISPFLRSASVRLAYGSALALLALAPIVVALSRRNETPEQRSNARVVVVFACLMFLGLFPSAIWSHLVAVLPPVLLLAAVVADRVEKVLRRRLPVLGRAWTAAFGLVLVAASVVSARVAVDMRRWHDEPLGLEHASLRVAPSQAVLYRGAVDYLHRCAAPGEPIFVTPDLPLVYFLADRPNPTPYEMAIPGDVDSDLLIARLDQAHTRCALYNPRMYVHFASLAEVFPKLARYVDSTFERAAVIEAEGTTWYGLVRREERRS